MLPDELVQKRWYWIRRTDGSLAPYVFHRVRPQSNSGGVQLAEFFVGSFIQTFRLNQIVAEAQMPTESDSPNGHSAKESA